MNACRVLHLHAGEVEMARHSRACVAGVAILQLPAQALDFGLCHLLLKVQINDDALTILHCLQANTHLVACFGPTAMPCKARQCMHAYTNMVEGDKGHRLDLEASSCGNSGHNHK